MALITGPLSTKLGRPDSLESEGLREYLESQQKLIMNAFTDGIFIDHLLGARAMVIDRVLCALWIETGLDKDHLGSSLLAVTVAANCILTQTSIS